ncbi:MAG: neutral/alkaline non-lysosomal ceramidase N-terminal domain-containing protein [Chloroherpetonaceae bacterium]|nr:neutral/alkaline non-lysosomal ceramidase N-terminal domain-containing protein [Chthonomonadaceae bacterium]MDW8206699.1 neutral/alkaline non-lysosomal ceramidase N-terminal domain-containing protein [Chloroherpetonaceae bacterium]
MRVLWFLLAIASFLVPGVCAVAELRAAAGKVDITPTRPAYLAGYAANRRSIGVHDRLWAKCLVLEWQGTRIAFVACDLLGVPRYQAEKIRAQVKSVLPERLYIAATHVHSGPDTLGQWGPDLRTSGVDPEWMATFRNQVVQLVEETAARLEPAVLKLASTTEVPRISRNARVPQILDRELGVLQVLSVQGNRTIATVVNYACHPEVLNNRQITADFPNWLYETVEGKIGGVCLYLNGALGGMVTADFDEDAAPRGENWKAAEEIGRSMGERVLQILETAETVRNAPIRTQRRVFRVPLENPRFRALMAMGIFPSDVLKNGQIETEVNRITIGPAEMLTLPGEVLPNIGLYLKRKMTGKPRFLLGLTCDELGYILTPEDYGLELYAYETSVSVGEHIGPKMVQNLLAMMEKPKGGSAGTQTVRAEERSK